jgi:phytoene desaturase
MKTTINIIGSGFSSLAASCYLAKAGYDVTIIEKNSTIGGRARQLKKEGFTFDIGPTWYWMPDVFERFFDDFNKKPSDYYALEKLNPAYSVYFGKDDFITIEDTLNKIKIAFEKEEPGSSKKLTQFIAKAKSNYDIAIKDLVYNPGVSPLELITPATIKKLNQFFSTIKRDVRKEFKNSRLIKILEFPVLFLGAKPSDTPSFYSFMNYADFGLGTFHPKKGMYQVVLAIEKLAIELGVKIKTNTSIDEIIVEEGTAKGVVSNGKTYNSDIVISGADYHHTETLLRESDRQYSEKYWSKKNICAFIPLILCRF